MSKIIKVLAVLTIICIQISAVAVDYDMDNDGIWDNIDNDMDNDGIWDNIDNDMDNDGIWD